MNLFRNQQPNHRQSQGTTDGIHDLGSVDGPSSDGPWLDGVSEDFGSLNDEEQNDDYQTTKAADEAAQERQKVQDMASHQEQRVRLWRRNVFALLFVVAGLVTTAAFLFLQQKQEEDFETSFREYAQTIREATQFSWQSLLGATRGLSQVATAQAARVNATWPFVTLGSFEVQTRNTRLLG